ncbi:MAG: nucleoside diphosphate kinase regulator [Xanthomonadales bacterium]|nr:nucleoside diphosphate kinase regulator [Xanthomonadales bacterium]
MSKQPATSNNPRPPLVISASHAARLTALADNALERLPDIAGRLLDELERAQTVPDDQLPDDVVAMGNQVSFQDEATGRDRVVRLVWPSEANIDAGRISVLTPVGTALIGLRVGQSIDWPVTDGSHHRLRITAVDR